MQNAESTVTTAGLIASTVRLTQEGTLNSRNDHTTRKASLLELLETTYSPGLSSTVFRAVIAPLSACVHYYMTPMTYILNTK